MTPAIRTEQLTKRYGGATALDRLDLEVRPGEVFGYLGPNGAGKSTTIGLLLGFLRPTSGRAEVLGFDVGAQARALHARLAYVPAGADLWPELTGAEVLRFLGALHGSVDTAYRDELVERFDLHVDTKQRALSHGNRQKVLLVAAFATRAEVLLLDEPTTGLDPLMEQVFQDCVREARDRGQTTFLSSHILSEVDAVCDRVAMLRHGRLIQVGPLEALHDLASVRVVAELSGPVPDLAAVAGIAGVTGATLDPDGRTLRCDVSGPIQPLLQTLADIGVARLATHEPSLEELFVARYGEPDGAP